MQRIGFSTWPALAKLSPHSSCRVPVPDIIARVPSAPRLARQLNKAPARCESPWLTLEARTSCRMAATELADNRERLTRSLKAVEAKLQTQRRVGPIPVSAHVHHGGTAQCVQTRPSRRTKHGLRRCIIALKLRLAAAENKITVVTQASLRPDCEAAFQDAAQQQTLRCPGASAHQTRRTRMRATAATTSAPAAATRGPSGSVAARTAGGTTACSHRRHRGPRARCHRRQASALGMHIRAVLATPIPVASRDILFYKQDLICHEQSEAEVLIFHIATTARSCRQPSKQHEHLGLPSSRVQSELWPIDEVLAAGCSRCCG